MLSNISFKFAGGLIHSTLSLIFIVSVQFDASFTNVRVLFLHAVRAVLRLNDLISNNSFRLHIQTIYDLAAQPYLRYNAQLVSARAASRNGLARTGSRELERVRTFRAQPHT